MEPATFPPPLDSEYSTTAWGIRKAYVGGEKSFEPMVISRAKVSDHQVNMEILYCGVCHSDVHTGQDDFGATVFPCVPGHELLGKVLEVGEKVTKFSIGDVVGVGCFVDACMECKQCQDGDQQYCKAGGMSKTYNGHKKHGRVGGNQETRTCGGYAATHTVHEDFIFKIPEGLPLEQTAPILCAGITMYDPLRHWGATKGNKMTIGIVGIGGLGTMGIKIAKALGHNVVAISTSGNKEALAKEKGADHFVVSTNKESVEAQSRSCDLILNTVSAEHELQTYLPLLAKKGTLIQLGLPKKQHKVNMAACIYNKYRIAGSLIGGIESTKEVLELCAKHNILPDCQIIKANQIDWAWERLNQSNQDGVRYVIDVKASLKDKSFIPPTAEQKM